MSWDEALGGFDERAAAHHHVDTYWFPHTDRLMVKTNDRLDDLDVEPLSRWRAWWDDEFLSNAAFGALNHLTNAAPSIIPRFNQLSSRLLSARSYSDVAHGVFTSPRDVVFREMEYAVPREAGLAALREARAAIDASDLKVTFPVEIRTTPADDIPMSTSGGRDSFYLAFHTHRDADHLEYFALLHHARPRRPPALGQGAHPHRGRPGAGVPALRRVPRAPRASSTRTGSSPTTTCAGSSATDPPRPAGRRQTLAGPVGIGACQCRQIASSRHTVHSPPPTSATTRVGRSVCAPATTTTAPGQRRGAAGSPRKTACTRRRARRAACRRRCR